MITSLIALLIYLIVIAILVGLVHYAVDQFQSGTPLGRFIKVAATVIGVLIVCLLLLDFAGIIEVARIGIAPRP